MKLYATLLTLLTSGALAEDGNTAYTSGGVSDGPGVGWYNQEQLTELLMPTAKKCFSDDEKLMQVANKIMAEDDSELMNAPDLFFDLLEDYCDDAQTAQFEKANKNFKKCSGIDLIKYQETVGDALIGMFFNCGRYMFNMMSTLGLAYYGYGDLTFPLDRVPDTCVESLVGDNPMGNAVREFMEYPGAESKCFAQLSEDLPQCTLKLWPIPIPGSILKVTSCLNSELVPEQRAMCDQQLVTLESCLPDDSVKLFSGKAVDEETCGEWTQQCALEMSTLITFPAPFNAMPLSDICQEQAKFHEDGLKKFNAFQKSCTSQKDRDFWINGAGSSTVSSFNKSSKKGKGGGGGGGSSFFIGFFTAAGVFALALFAKKKMNGGTSYFDLAGNNDLSLQENHNRQYELS